MATFWDSSQTNKRYIRREHRVRSTRDDESSFSGQHTTKLSRSNKRLDRKCNFKGDVSVLKISRRHVNDLPRDQFAMIVAAFQKLFGRDVSRGCHRIYPR